GGSTETGSLGNGENKNIQWLTLRKVSQKTKIVVRNQSQCIRLTNRSGFSRPLDYEAGVRLNARPQNGDSDPPQQTLFVPPIALRSPHKPFPAPPDAAAAPSTESWRQRRWS